MRGSLGVEQMLTWYYDKNVGRKPGNLVDVTNYSFRFSPSAWPSTWPQAAYAHYDASFAATRAWFGSWQQGTVREVGNGQDLEITLYNRTGWKSYALHLATDIPRVPGTKNQPYSTISQRLTFTVPLDVQRLQGPSENADDADDEDDAEHSIQQRPAGGRLDWR